ncbi:MAG: hypothetical protein V3W20_07005 [Candidatus Neomarinimicrobiota bacterium]
MTTPWKVIKPNKLNSPAMLKQLKIPVVETIKSADKEFAKTYATWKHKPRFVQKFQEKSKSLFGSITTTSKGSKNNPYPFMRGTKAHIIRPKKAKMLRFQTGYKAKTTVGKIGSRTGGSFGPTVFANEVKHPGTKDRKFEEIIAKKEQPKFFKRGTIAMKKVAKVSGQSA